MELDASAIDKLAVMFAKHDKSRHTELEASIGGSTLTREQFMNVFKHLGKCCGSYTEEPITLDIRTSSNCRCTIHGSDAISSYCSTGVLPSEGAVFMKKTIHDKEDIVGHGIRFRLATEEPLSDDVANRNLINDFYNKELTFRNKRRFCFKVSNELRADLTVVQQGRGRNLKSAILERQYEVELEYLQEQYTASHFVHIMDWVIELAKAVNKELVLVDSSKKRDIRREYMDIAAELTDNHIRRDTDDSDVMRNPKRFLITPKPVTLEHKHVAQDSSSNIFKGYTVTDKADGERVLAYVSKTDGSLYLINNVMNVMGTGIRVTKPEFHHSLFDCELVDQQNQKVLLIFDAYYLNGSPKHQLHLTPQVQGLQVAEQSLEDMDKHEAFAKIEEIRYKQLRKKEPHLEYRYWIVKDFVEQNSAALQTKQGLSVQAKVICRFDSFDDFKRQMLRMYATYESGGYGRDGFIFTPAEEAPVMGKAWMQCFKWKKPEDNTIDFQVRIRRIPNTQQALVTYDQDGKQYSELELYVGSALGAPSDLISGQARGGYKARLFTPAPIARIPLNRDGLMLCENNDIIQDMYVVEMSYDLITDNWQPKRVRFDKYEEFVRTRRINANDIENARAVWRTIQSPIREEVIRGNVGLMMATGGEDDRYYARVGNRNQSGIKHMNNFHNLWIKKHVLLQRFAGRRYSLLDIGCGKGGDIRKWVDCKFSSVLGVDSCEDNLLNDADGAYRRAMEVPESVRPAMAFLPMDAVVDFKDQVQRIRDPYLRSLAMHMWGLAKDPSIPDAYFNRVSRGYDVVSCQFAIHYFFNDEADVDRFMQNMVSCIKPGAYFVGTCLDGSAVAAKLQDTTVAKGGTDSKTLWEIRRLYDGFQPLTFGQKISVYIETINQFFEENLVSYDLLSQVMAKYHFRPLNEKELADLDAPASTGTFQDAHEMLLQSDDVSSSVKEAAQQMTDPECEYSFLNRWFIFRYDPATSKRATATPRRRGRPPKTKIVDI